MALSTDEIAALIGRAQTGQPAFAPEFADDPKRARAMSGLGSIFTISTADSES